MDVIYIPRTSGFRQRRLTVFSRSILQLALSPSIVCIFVNFHPPEIVRIESVSLLERINCITHHNHTQGSYTPTTQSEAWPRISGEHLYEICVIGLYIECIFEIRYFMHVVYKRVARISLVWIEICRNIVPVYLHCYFSSSLDYQDLSQVNCLICISANCSLPSLSTLR